MQVSDVITKIAQAIHRAPVHTPATMEAYPDYGKSLSHQRHRDPAAAGRQRAVGTGITGAAIGALIARTITDNRAAVAAGAGLGGAAGAALGYQSGKGEADSDYSRVLFLRRRMGINEPGELEALLKHPAMAREMIDKKGSVKIAADAKTIARVIAGVVGGGTLGWGLGTEGMSRVMDYHDDPGARHMGGAINAANLAVIGGLLGHNPATLGRFMHEHFAAPASMVGMELLPSAKKSLTEISNASMENASNQVSPSINRALTSTAGRGAGVGAGLAGLAAVASGLGRARSDKEIGHDTSRAQMIGKDFSKYVIPAALLGGVAGSLRKKE